MSIRVLSVKSVHRAGRQVGTWFIETRPLFLMGSIGLAILGTAVAWWDGSFSLHNAVLAFVGLLLWHISVNVLNDYFDYRSGVDLQTRRTAFSGGSGILPAQLLQAESVLKFGLICFALAVPIWIYFIIVKGLLLLPLVAVGAVCVLLYSPVLTRLGLGEISSSLGIGTLPILAFYFVQTGNYAAEAVVAAIASGLLMFGLHLLNGFPDVKADRAGGRRTLPIVVGQRKAAWLYLTVMIGVYAWVIAWSKVGMMPQTALLCLVSIPLTAWAVKGAMSYRSQTSYAPTLWANVIAYSVTLVLLALGYIVDGL